MVELELLGRVLIAAGLSGVIGVEREFHGRPAGLRTHILVGSGAALAMVSATALAGIDSARIAAGIITGIGFLGAGTIMRGENWVRGLTTAASVWFVATVGILAGDGLWVLATGGTALGLIVLEAVDYLEHRITSTVARMLTIVVSAAARTAVCDAARARLRDAGIRVNTVGWGWNQTTAQVTLRFQLHLREDEDLTPVLEKIAALSGVNTIELDG